MRNLKILRERAGLTQQELADRISVDRTAVAHWEAGEFKPRSARLPKLATALNCRIDEFFYC